MKNAIDILEEKFNEIKRMGWVKSLRSGPTGIGYTFETFLGKEEENFSFPDFYEIEIKTKHYFSKGYITLFNATPDGEFLFPLDYIRNKYGYRDKSFKDVKLFQYSIQNEKDNELCGKHFSLLVDREKEKVYLCVSNQEKEIIDKSISWSFSYLEEKLTTKLSLLAVVFANSKLVGDDEYLQYTKLKLYKLKDFDTFLNLIEIGKIRITFKLGVFKSGERKGQVHDHGTGFDIQAQDIHLLYDEYPT